MYLIDLYLSWLISSLRHILLGDSRYFNQLKFYSDCLLHASSPFFGSLFFPPIFPIVLLCVFSLHSTFLSSQSSIMLIFCFKGLIVELYLPNMSANYSFSYQRQLVPAGTPTMLEMFLVADQSALIPPSLTFPPALHNVTIPPPAAASSTVQQQGTVIVISMWSAHLTQELLMITPFV